MIDKQLAQTFNAYSDRYRAVQYRVSRSKKNDSYKLNCHIEAPVNQTFSVSGTLADPEHNDQVIQMIQTLIDIKKEKTNEVN